MRDLRHLATMLGCLVVVVFLTGCAGTLSGANRTRYPFPAVEPDWIRNGDPIVYEDRSWYPQDDIDVLLDSEVYLLGEYNGVQFFAEKADVRPYGKLYTKFDENRYRIYQQERDD